MSIIKEALEAQRLLNQQYSMMAELFAYGRRVKNPRRKWFTPWRAKYVWVTPIGDTITAKKPARFTPGTGAR